MRTCDTCGALIASRKAPFGHAEPYFNLDGTPHTHTQPPVYRGSLMEAVNASDKIMRRAVKRGAPPKRRSAEAVEPPQREGSGVS